MRYIVDSYAWVEYLIGSHKGEILKRLFSEENNSFYTIECCLAEIKGWSLKNNQDFNKGFTIIRANSEIIQVTEYDWIKAGEERFQQRKTQKDFGLIDAVLLVKQQQLNCRIVMGDKHFKNLKNILFLE